MKTLIQRFQEKYVIDATTHCWNWTGSTSRGYGYIGNNGKIKRAARISYELFKSVILSSLEIDHLCRNILCVNPEHLEPVSHRENVLRGNGLAAQQARRSHCIHGHEFNSINTYLSPSGRKRECKVCRRTVDRRRKCLPKFIN